MLANFGGQGFGAFKPALADLAVAKLGPIRDPAFLEHVRALLDSYGDRFTVAEIGGDDATREMKLFCEGDRAIALSPRHCCSTAPRTAKAGAAGPTASCFVITKRGICSAWMTRTSKHAMTSCGIWPLAVMAPGRRRGRATDHPGYATALGNHDYDDQVEDLSAVGRARDAAFLRATLAELAAIPRASLSRDDQVDAALLDNDLRYQLWTLEVLQPFAWDPQGAAGWPSRVPKAIRCALVM